MLLTMMKSKIHRATVTEAVLEYEGSITIDENLLEAANMLPFEKVQVLNVNNGTRIETYIIKGERGSGIICVNGPAARLFYKGDEVIVIAYAEMSEDEARKIQPKIVFVDKNNVIKSKKG
ncbi:MAG TPA: aspartate 1-decarboxylase [Spirochaetota bacterium]|nr:aspartate 1-decarboxylase [Spirochaetota bacterium]